MSRNAMKISLSLSIMTVLLLGYTNCSNPKVEDSGVNPFSSISDPNNKLEIVPANKTVGLGESLQLSVNGGTPPYRFNVTNGGGSVDANTGFFVAPTVDSESVVNVEDITGKVGQVVIRVSINSSSAMTLSYTPSGAVNIGTVLTLTATGGTAPYTYSIYSGVGSITGNKFSATSSGSAVIAVHDSAQKISTFTIAVGSSTVVTTAPIYQLYNSSTKQYLFSTTKTEGTTNNGGFKLQSSTPAFKVLKGSYIGSATLNRCYIASNGGRFLTAAATCSGNTLEGSIGVIWTYAAVNSTPLYNCFKPSTGTYFISTSTSACTDNGFNVTTPPIGWVPL